MSYADQAEKLRRIMGKSDTARTIAVASGKGGVGKSNIALNLAVLLSAAGNRVALVDADMGLANLDVLLDVDVRGNLSHVIAGTRTLEEILVELPAGVQFVPGASGLAQVASLSEFQRACLIEQLSALEAENDIIVIDCGAGIGRDVMHFASGADTLLAVTAPEPTAVTDAYAMIKVLARQQYNGTISLVVNLAADRAEARSTYQRISEVAGQFLGVTVLDGGHVLIDPKVREAVRKRQPLVLGYPRCPASRCIAAMANRLSRGKWYGRKQEGFFRRVANWFA
jgi:flagellar biosynthesis protein FlhG